MAGYSATPLAKKLGIKDGFQINLINAPDYYFSLFTDLPANLSINTIGDRELDFVHFFTKQRDEYEQQLPLIKAAIRQNGMIWVSWPKKASKVPTDITEDIIHNYGLQIGLVDIKVCAVDEVWSGLKLVIPVKDRV
ncbi:DUF3052 domain-containing protein [Mucilaginibacter jinjuensis]|uniref:DUF3052 domain-containing protein n=1 Tax=Mucilaginibacter jinjuensis TaxID=1176721 RepID=A0ABY7T282_9SPHI|nr:DUF3052 domain-containing protein [Mucilaginibacter jinjuensis]WCT10270.1 DUF3052 domain-containing protein [Mucilaginibacter jinjuensis]